MCDKLLVEPDPKMRCLRKGSSYAVIRGGGNNMPNECDIEGQREPLERAYRPWRTESINYMASVANCI